MWYCSTRCVRAQDTHQANSESCGRLRPERQVLHSMIIDSIALLDSGAANTYASERSSTVDERWSIMPLTGRAVYRASPAGDLDLHIVAARRATIA